MTAIGVGPRGWAVLFVVALASCRTAVSEPTGALALPADLDDGWAVAAPASAGIDEAELRSVADRVARGEFGAVEALVIVRHGRLVYERTWRGYDGREPHTLQSVTKSVTSALIGIALERGEIESLDLTLGELFPDYQDILGSDPAKSGIRIRDLLSMRAGMAWDEHSYPFSDDRNDTGRMNRAQDWIRVALEQPMTSVPGSTWVYNSGAAILLSGILLRKTGEDAIEYADEHLFGPLAFGEYRWYRNPVNGLPHTGGGLSVKPRDLARFGQLYLDDGRWGSHEVLSTSWVRDSETVFSDVGENGYGYMWWTRPLRGITGHTPNRADVPFGWGYGGQHVFVAPDLDLVVVVNAWNVDGGTRGPALFDALMPAMEGR